MKKWVMFSFLILLLTACAETGSQNSKITEIGRSERFVAYDNGTVKDLTTGLMWAAADSGGPIRWSKAKTYCNDYRGGGYDDWRMPTNEELKAIYNLRIINPYPVSEGCKGVCHITRFIHLSCCPVWSWDGINEVETFFHFHYGPKDWRDQSLATHHPRVLPVRDER
ncbi:MAG: hypothetical protein B6240_00800 [Desulfobacteraceae bacterium 4572_87]|nr:MAG: hypothetical protein B6240_00800 [Desulfobacteraceae bacterium 4572_87]